jgi:hypothetical protein
MRAPPNWPARQHWQSPRRPLGDHLCDRVTGNKREGPKAQRDAGDQAMDKTISEFERLTATKGTTEVVMSKILPPEQPDPGPAAESEEDQKRENEKQKGASDEN